MANQNQKVEGHHEKLSQIPPYEQYRSIIIRVDTQKKVTVTVKYLHIFFLARIYLPVISQEKEEALKI
jgi:hypothetical protein